MASKKKQTTAQKHAPDSEQARGASPDRTQKAKAAQASKSDSEAHKQLSEPEPIKGQGDSRGHLADDGHVRSTRPAQPALDEIATTDESHGKSQSRPLAWYGSLSSLQKVLLVGIMAAAMLLAYAVCMPNLGAGGNSPGKAVADRAVPSAMKVDDGRAIRRVAAEPTGGQRRELGSGPPLSLRYAEQLYMKKDFAGAFSVYQRLGHDLGCDEHSAASGFKDLLLLKMASCLIRTGQAAVHIGEPANLDKAVDLLITVSQSPSPVLRVAANYNLAVLDLRNHRFLQAHARAYEALTLIGALDLAENSCTLLDRNCRFIVAESLTRELLRLCDGDRSVPEDLWGKVADWTDPFVNLDEEQIRALLKCGLDRLRTAILSPEIEQLQHAGGNGRSVQDFWRITCRGASIQELMARFAAHAGLDVRWFLTGASSRTGIEQAVRDRPVTLYMPSVTTAEFVTAAAGSAALLAEFGHDGVVSIYNPRQYTCLSDHLSVLTRKSISLWQRFLLAFQSDTRVANAHFAIGLLEAQRGRADNAIAEYKLVASSFAGTCLAPFALLNSGKLKAGLRNFSGAQQDLRRLVEQYPHSELAGQARLYLAEMTERNGLVSEAARLYTRIYNFGYGAQSQNKAALGAGRCYWQSKDYENAAQWLNRYVNATKDLISESTEGGYAACLLLGKSYLALDKPEPACVVLEYALAQHPPTEQYIELVSTAVEAYSKKAGFVEALDLLESVSPWDVSKGRYGHILALKAGVLRQMGLVDKAISVIGDRVDYEREQQLRAKLSLELARCHSATGDLELASGILSETLAFVEPGPDRHQIAIELADVCLKLGRTDQTISICRRVMDSQPSDVSSKRVRELLAAAHIQQKEYDQAALALLGPLDEDAPQAHKAWPQARSTVR